MGFERPSVEEVSKKDLTRMHRLIKELETYVDDPCLDELDSTMTRILKLDRPPIHEPMD